MKTKEDISAWEKYELEKIRRTYDSDLSNVDRKRMHEGAKSWNTLPRGFKIDFINSDFKKGIKNIETLKEYILWAIDNNQEVTNLTLPHLSSETEDIIVWIEYRIKGEIKHINHIRDQRLEMSRPKFKFRSKPFSR